MTEPQRVWESWFQAFTTIRDAWPSTIEVPCPSADGGQVRVAYVGDPADRIGIGFAWCDVGQHGIYLARLGIPEGAPMVSFDATDAEIAAVVPPEIEFFEPDPAPPATEDQ